MREQKFSLALGIMIIFISTLVIVSPAISQFPDPDRSFKLIVPFSVGTKPDTLARIFGSSFSKSTNQNVTIVNLPNAIEGWNILSRAEPDGYTIGIFVDPYIKLLRKKNKETPSIDQFAPIAVFAKEEYILVTAPHMQLKSLNDLKKFPNPETIKFAITGLTNEFFTTKLELKLNIETNKLSFKSYTESLQALIGGYADLLIAPVSVVKPLVQSQKINALAVFTDKNLDSLPEIPTAKNQGINLLFSNNYGMMAPANTPPEIIDKLQIRIKQFYESERYGDYRDSLKKSETIPYFMNEICAEGTIPCDDDCC